MHFKRSVEFSFERVILISNVRKTLTLLYVHKVLEQKEG